MLLASGAGRTVGADAGLAYLREGTFEGGPPAGQLGGKGAARAGDNCLHQSMYIIIHTYMPTPKRPRPRRQQPPTTFPRHSPRPLDPPNPQQLLGVFLNL